MTKDQQKIMEHMLFIGATIASSRGKAERNCFLPAQLQVAFFSSLEDCIDALASMLEKEFEMTEEDGEKVFKNVLTKI